MESNSELAAENRSLRGRIAELERTGNRTAGDGTHFIQQLIDALPVPVYVKDAKSVYRFCNRAFAECFGLPRAGIIGHGLYETSPRDLARQYARMDRLLLKNGGVQIYETEVEAMKSGIRRTVEFRKSLFTGPDGETAGIVGVGFDVSERTALKEKEALLAAAQSAVGVVAALPEGIILTDPAGRVTSVNPAYASLTGRSTRGMAGKNVTDLAGRLFMPGDVAAVRAFLRRLVSGKGTAPFAARLKGAGKRSVPVLVSGAAVTGRNGFRIVGLLDITELVRARDEAAATDARFRKLFDTTHDAIVITGRDGTFLEVNDAYLKLVGLRGRKALAAYKAGDFYANPADRPRMKRDLEKRGYATDYEFRMRRKNGRLIDTVHTIAVRTDPKGRVLGYQGIIRDVTDKKRMEAALREAEKNRMTAGITGLVSALEARDPYTRGHSEAVSEIVTGMARLYDVSEEELDKVRLGGMLHDIGKIGVRDSVLLKPGKLTEREYAHIKKHPRLGARILRSMPYLPGILDIVRSHHERMDGKGYPAGLEGQAIPLYARMTAVADTYHALISDRPYRKGMELGRALGIINEVRGTQLCAECVELFFAWVGKGK